MIIKGNKKDNSYILNIILQYYYQFNLPPIRALVSLKQMKLILITLTDIHCWRAMIDMNIIAKAHGIINPNGNS